ncbi:DUF368 domain-containing protein [Bacteroidota bacterium]
MAFIKKYIILFLKGLAMGAANIIPGVSGGTIALVTGIFEKLINSIKSIDIYAIKLIFNGKFREFSEHINLLFLLTVFLGIGISIISLASLLKFLLVDYPVYVWAFFFGLILASAYYVGKRVEKWKFNVILMIIMGIVIAFSISTFNPGSENDSFIYLFICGIVAICSMILPGLSGSFVLILMGNYQLVMIDSITELNLIVLIPVIVGAIFGLIAFSHLLSWIFKKYKNQTISFLTGFIIGSLGLLWPWKNAIPVLDNVGNQIIKHSGELVNIYKPTLPESFDSTVIIAIILIIAGISCIWIMEKLASQKPITK